MVDNTGDHRRLGVQMLCFPLPGAGVTNDDQRRRMKRYRAVQYIESTKAYRTAWTFSSWAMVPLVTPNPYDLQITKRSWERQVQQWRKEIRRLSVLADVIDVSLEITDRQWTNEGGRRRSNNSV